MTLEAASQAFLTAALSGERCFFLAFLVGCSWLRSPGSPERCWRLADSARARAGGGSLWS
eukprot:11228816-Alexandrium_andersonii.AAC.1